MIPMMVKLFCPIRIVFPRPPFPSPAGRAGPRGPSTQTRFFASSSRSVKEAPMLDPVLRHFLIALIHPR